VVWIDITASCNLAYVTGDADQGHYDTEPYGDFPNPLVPSHLNDKYSIYCTYSTDGGVEKNFFGAISQQFTITSTRTWSFNRYSGVTASFTVTSTKTASFNIQSTINQIFSVNNQRTWSLTRFSTVSPIFTVVGEYVEGVFRDFFGSISQIFSTSTAKTVSFELRSLFNPTFTVLGWTQFTQPGVLNFFGSINQIVEVLSYFPLAPEQLGLAFVMAAFAMVMAIIALTLSLRRRREEPD